MVYISNHSKPRLYIAYRYNEVSYNTKIWQGKFWCFWCFLARPSKFNLSNTIYYLQVHGERQWPSVKIFSIKYLKSQYPLKFPPSKFCAIRYIYRNTTLICDCLSKTRLAHTCQYFKKYHFENSIKKVSLALVLYLFTKHNNTYLVIY